MSDSTRAPGSGELVPFGKYKGQPVEVLLADQGYRDWLMSQDWFRSRYGNVYQTIINYGAEPQETPEHNELQASFLDDGRCFRLARLLYPNHPFDKAAADRAAGRATYRRDARTWYEKAQGLPVRALCEEFKDHIAPYFEEPRIYGRKFEAGGWDVVYDIDPASLIVDITSLPLCPCGDCDHATDCPGVSPCRGGDGREYQCQHNRHQEIRKTPTPEWLTKSPGLHSLGQRTGHCHFSCPWANDDKASWLLESSEEARWYQPTMPGSIKVECKPDLGDDFPAVLRQVTRYESKRGDRCCVVIRRASFEKVVWEQVEAIFAASGIVLLRESRLDEVNPTKPAPQPAPEPAFEDRDEPPF